MGLIDFVKSAGENLLQRVSGGPEVNADGIVQAIQSHGLQVQNLQVGVQEDVATVAGTTETQTDKEKVVLVVGNTQGVARVNDELQVEPPKPETPPQPPSTYYEVVSGDSLSKIAKAHYGDAMKYPVIFEANKPMLTDPDKIYPGQVLRIPPL
ncbi:MAG: peptidoglycan-binding protein LysM [Myxococcota bacterium]